MDSSDNEKEGSSLIFDLYLNKIGENGIQKLTSFTCTEIKNCTKTTIQLSTGLGTSDEGSIAHAQFLMYFLRRLRLTRMVVHAIFRIYI